METAPLVLTYHYNVEPHKVFEAWHNAEKLKKWFAPSEAMSVPIAEVDFTVGGKYKIAMKSPDGEVFVVEGAYKEIVENEKIVFDWKWQDSKLEPGTSEITIELTKTDNGTDLKLTQVRLSSDESRMEHTKGWTGCLEQLAKQFV
jgi:uncharacterized protein YndB with AHSA1/START domain